MRETIQQESESEADSPFLKGFEDLFQAAKSGSDEFAYVFALLGINSGSEDAGWQPIEETFRLISDITAIAQTPLRPHTQIRLLLLLYCQITESSFMYHILYNLLICIEGEAPPKVFNFMDKIKNGNPPSVKTKVAEICKKADRLGHNKLGESLKSVFDSGIRNAVSHADFILFNDELRLKHKGTEIRKVKLNEVLELVNRTLLFFQTFFYVLDKHKKSYPNGHVIKGRKNKKGQNLMSITLKADQNGFLNGFSGSDPLPLW